MFISDWINQLTCLDWLELVCPVQMLRLTEYMMFMRFQIKLMFESLMHIPSGIFNLPLSLVFVMYKQLSVIAL